MGHRIGAGTIGFIAELCPMGVMVIYGLTGT
jgi:hypothetical protein